jgi:RNA recognition motif-containing protein
MSNLGTTDIIPNQTIYVNNLNEKVKKDELKRSLYHVFSQFGNILEIIATKTYKMRGQAWVIFDDLQGATKALREMQGFQFYGKAMRVTFAKAKSDVVSKMDGSFIPRPKRKIEGKASKSSAHPAKKKKVQQEKQQEKQQNGDSKYEEKEDKAENKPDTKPQQQQQQQQQQPAPAPQQQQPPLSVASLPPYQEQPAPPNRILFVENLPTECNQMMLSMLFQQYAGFQEVRLVNGKPGIAFVEFGDEYSSSLAKNALQNFKITPTNLMKISFAKK